jgi:hypothetical protein
VRTIGSFCQKCATPDWVQSSKHEHCQGDIVAQRAHAVSANELAASPAWIHVAQMEFMLRPPSVRRSQRGCQSRV